MPRLRERTERGHFRSRVLEKNREAQLVDGLGAPAQLGIFVRTKEPRDPHKKARVRPLVRFPIELKLPGPITLPPIPQEGRGRPSALTNARARMILALTCTGATVDMIAAAGGVTPSTLRSWLTRRDHEAYRMFQEAFAAPETYAALAALKAIMEGMHADPKIAFEFLARRHPDQWGKVVGQDGGDSGKHDGDAYVLPGVKADLGSMLERIFLRFTQTNQNGPFSLDVGSNGVLCLRDVLAKLGSPADINVYVGRVDSLGEWCEPDYFDDAVKLEDMLASIGPPDTEGASFDRDLAAYHKTKRPMFHADVLYKRRD